jgi:hypothetical protein
MRWRYVVAWSCNRSYRFGRRAGASPEGYLGCVSTLRRPPMNYAHTSPRERQGAGDALARDGQSGNKMETLTPKLAIMVSTIKRNLLM